MVKKKVLITGGSGYIGARLCLYLADQGYSITALCHSKLPADVAWIAKMENVIVGDLKDESFINELALNRFEVVIHLVSLDHHQSNNGSPSDVSAVNIVPVWSLLDAFAKNGLEKFIYFSTMQVYGTVPAESINEGYAAKTLSPYGLTHHIGEVLCDYYNRTSAVQCSAVRLSNSYGAPVFGDNNCWWLVINDLCQMAFLKKEIVLQSDGSPLRDFIHGWDVCKGVQLIIETSEEHILYNLSSGVTLSIMEISQKIKTVFFNRYNVELSIKAAESISNAKANKYVLDNSLLKSIGFETKWTLEDGINELFDFLELNYE